MKLNTKKQSIIINNSTEGLEQYDPFSITVTKQSKVDAINLQQECVTVDGEDISINQGLYAKLSFKAAVSDLQGFTNEDGLFVSK